MSITVVPVRRNLPSSPCRASQAADPAAALSWYPGRWTMISPSLRSALAAATGAWLLAAHADAQPAKGAPGKRVDVGAAVQKLKSGSEDQIRSGLDDVRLGGPAAVGAAPAIAELLSRGLNEPLSLAALDTLGDIEAPEASPVVALYASHRALTLRRAAVRALGRTKGTGAAAALRRALGDPDGQVRGAAALGLGALKAKEAVADLFTALDHKVNEAAAAIGQLCGPDECERLAQKLGKLPFDIVTSGLDQLLFRPSVEVSDDTKVKVLGHVRELGTAESNRYLKEVDKRLPKDASPRVRQAVEQAVKATSGGLQ